MKRKPKLKKYPDGGFIPLDPLNLVGYRRQILKNPDGSFSTESTIGITGEDGKYYNIPTVINGKRLSFKEAVDEFHKTGNHMGVFNTQEEADKSAEYREKANIGWGSTGLIKYKSGGVQLPKFSTGDVYGGNPYLSNIINPSDPNRSNNTGGTNAGGGAAYAGYATQGANMITPYLANQSMEAPEDPMINKGYSIANNIPGVGQYIAIGKAASGLIDAGASHIKDKNVSSAVDYFAGSVDPLSGWSKNKAMLDRGEESKTDAAINVGLHLISPGLDTARENYLHRSYMENKQNNTNTYKHGGKHKPKINFINPQPGNMMYGTEQFPNGGQSMIYNAEVESSENTLNPDGSTNQYNGPSHEQGGIPTQLDPGTLIFSDRLKLPGTNKTFAKLNKSNNTDKQQKVLDDENATSTAKQTAQLIKDIKNNKSMELFKAQEELKNSRISNYANKLGEDGIMYKDGGIHIKPSHKGRFTAYLKRTGSTLQEALHSKNPHVRQMANFARNAKHWKHANGGVQGLPKFEDGAIYPTPDGRAVIANKEEAKNLRKGIFNNKPSINQQQFPNGGKYTYNPKDKELLAYNDSLNSAQALDSLHHFAKNDPGFMKFNKYTEYINDKFKTNIRDSSDNTASQYRLHLEKPGYYVNVDIENPQYPTNKVTLKEMPKFGNAKVAGKNNYYMDTNKGRVWITENEYNNYMNTGNVPQFSHGGTSMIEEDKENGYSDFWKTNAELDNEKLTNNTNSSLQPWNFDSYIPQRNSNMDSDGYNYNRTYGMNIPNLNTHDTHQYIDTNGNLQFDKFELSRLNNKSNNQVKSEVFNGKSNISQPEVKPPPTTPQPNWWDKNGQYMKDASAGVAQAAPYLWSLNNNKFGKKYDTTTPYLTTPHLLSDRETLKDSESAYKTALYNSKQLGGPGTLAAMNNAYANKVMNDAKIREYFANQNAGILNQTDEFNIGQKNLARDLNMKSKARSEDQARLDMQGLSNTAANVNKDYNTNVQQENMIKYISSMYPDFTFDRRRGWFYNSKGEELKLKQ